ncbi:ATP-binding protein [Parapedobacter sp. SGR-10]|uniref:ATP-binding protein n=1 Tax=Parapedobacter sp. SGR-10 TaxID=2710879 RepID=UPI0013D5AE02|nr:AAA family ATPase [Parapedobacter sp. SGR-10]NGF55157.1 ATP-binding protein [Parapedobacter sp. SGR-10]
METLLLEHQAKLVRTSDKTRRYLYQKVDFSNRLIAIKGARGSGKTTLLLQWAKRLFASQSSLYVSLDHIWFYENKLYDLAKRFAQFGGTHLLLDEVHKYPDWSREIKLIYDNFPELNVIFTSSSILEIYRSESDLSRRAVSYDLKELSFREFIAFEIGKNLPVYALADLLEHHTYIATELMAELKPLPLFDKYLKTGVYPYYKENEAAYGQKLLNTINLTIEIDVNAVEHLAYETLVKLKKLLKAIASSVPFTPNISKLSEHVGLTRNGLVHAIKILARAGLVHELYKNTSGIGVLTKPEKLYLNNTNLLYALAEENTKTGNVRETFFLNQLAGLHTVNLSEKADFLIDNTITIEVGGKNKAKKQILGLDNAYIARDEIEVGYGNVIPVWLFGFLY